MKRVVKTLILITTIIFLVACGNSSGKTEENLIYRDILIGEEVVAYEIIGHKDGLGSNITLPTTFATAEHGQKPITKIGVDAFRSSNIKKITIPEGYTEISDGAFLNSLKLEEVIFNEKSNLTIIGKNAFRFTTNLQKIKIPKSVKIIDEHAFSGALSLSSVIFEEGSSLEEIGNNAFAETNALKAIKIPSSVKNIGVSVFYDSKKLEAINVDEANQYYTSVEGVLYNKDKTGLVIYPSGKKQKEYQVLDSATEILKNAFYGNLYLEKIVLPNNLLIINEFSFARTKVLSKIVIPLSVELVVKDAFKESLGLTIFLMQNNIPETWSVSWNSSNLKVYNGNEWDYDTNGNPMPK